MLYIPYPFKKCSKCHDEFLPTLEFFASSKRSKDRLTYQCRNCDRAYAAEKRRRYPERIKVSQTRYAKTEKAKSKKRQNNKTQKAKARYRRYRQTDKYKAAQARYRNSEKGVVSGRTISLNYQAQKRGAEGHYTTEDVQAQYKRQKGHCYYCGEKVGMKYHVDHVIPLSRGGSNGPENLVIACPTCNVKKHDKLPHEWPDGGRLL